MHNLPSGIFIIFLLLGDIETFEFRRPVTSEMVSFSACRKIKRKTNSCLSAAVSPIAWVGPDDSADLQLGRPACSPYSQAPLFDPFVRPTKKRATRIPSKIYRANAYSSTESR